MKAPKILFFVDGMAPSAEDLAAASEINGQVVFRNARAVPSEGALETCDGVAGKVPPQYSKLPTAEQATAKRAAKVKALASKVGDSPAPAAPVAPQGNADPAQGTASAATGAQDGAGAGEPATDPAKDVAPGAAPAGNAGAAWGAGRSRKLS